MLFLGKENCSSKILRTAIAAFCLAVICTGQSLAKDLWGPVKKAVETSTLDQPGTKAFHLKATFAPSLERDKDTHREGEIEIWWQSPTVWRRELRCPEFHQIAIQNGNRTWQKNEGDYFPEWLEELTTAILRPVPLDSHVLERRVKSGEIRQLAGQTNINWEPTTDFPDERANGKGYISLTDKTGLLLYAGGPGFGGLYHDFKDFHGRRVARTVAAGTTEVTAKITVLEDLGSVPSAFFDASAPGGDPQPIETVVLSEDELRKNLIPGPPFSWPALKDGPLEGVVWTEIVLDRSGSIREMLPPVSDNPGLQEAATAGFRSMRFQPILRNGVPVQAMGRISEHFKTVRPSETEAFKSAREYFSIGRKASFLAAGSTSPYNLNAEFQVGMSSGVETGRYEDIWISASEWKREAWFGSSHLVRSQAGDKYYVLSEGPQAGILRLVMQLVEPIPADDTMTESDWRIRRDTVEGVPAIRVARGPDGANGELDPARSQVYWFDDAGHLLKSYLAGFEVRMAEAHDCNGVDVARNIDVLKDGKVGLRFTVQDIGVADPAAAKKFKLKGHEWKRAFTAEAR